MNKENNCTYINFFTNPSLNILNLQNFFLQITRCKVTNKISIATPIQRLFSRCKVPEAGILCFTWETMFQLYSDFSYTHVTRLGNIFYTFRKRYEFSTVLFSLNTNPLTGPPTGLESLNKYMKIAFHTELSIFLSRRKYSVGKHRENNGTSFLFARSKNPYTSPPNPYIHPPINSIYYNSKLRFCSRFH